MAEKFATPRSDDPEGYDSAVKLADVEFTAERVNDTYFNPLSYLGFRALAKRHGGDLEKFYRPVTAGRVPEEELKKFGSNLSEFFKQKATEETGNQHPQVMGDQNGTRNLPPIYATATRAMYAPGSGKVHVNVSDIVDLYHSGVFQNLTLEEALDLQKEDVNRTESHEFGHAGFKFLNEQGKLPPGDFLEEHVMEVLDSIQHFKRSGTARPILPARQKLNYKDTALVRVPVARIAMGVISQQQDIPYPYSKKLTRHEKRWVNYILALSTAAENELVNQSRFPPAPESNVITNFFRRYFGSEEEREPEKQIPPRSEVRKAHGGFIDKPLYERTL